MHTRNTADMEMGLAHLKFIGMPVVRQDFGYIAIFIAFVQAVIVMVGANLIATTLSVGTHRKRLNYRERPIPSLTEKIGGGFIRQNVTLIASLNWMKVRCGYAGQGLAEKMAEII